MVVHVPHVAHKNKESTGNFGKFGTMWPFDSCNLGPLSSALDSPKNVFIAINHQLKNLQYN